MHPRLMFCALVALAPLISVAADKPRLVVLDIVSAGGIEPQLTGAIAEAITAEIGARGFFDPVSSKDIQTLIGLERQRQLAGCSDEAASCMAELADALGARFVMSGTLARLGDAYQLTLQTLDSRKAQPIGRATRIAEDLRLLQAQVPFAVAEATGTPLPAQPSRVLPYSLMGGGGLAVLGGALVSLDALVREQALNRELRDGEANPETLRPLATYRAENSLIRAERIGGLVALGVGAALIGAGVYLDRRISAGAAPRAAVVPTANGIAIVGVFQ